MDATRRDETEIMAVLSPSAPRRALAVVVLGALGLLLGWLAVASAPGVLWRAMLAALALGALLGARGVWRATARRLELSADGLREEDGRPIAALEEIEAVDSGIFAFKPSNGFALRLRRGARGRGWAPGLWWRVGRRVGVGGATAAPQARAMAQILRAMLEARDEERQAGG